MTALLLEMFLFWFRVECELQLVSYSPKHTPQSLSDMTFFVYFKHKLKTMHFQLQFYRTPNDFPTSEDASPHAESSKAVQATVMYIHQCLVIFLFQYTRQQN